MKTETIDISLLVFDPSNARKHNKKNLDAIKGSLARFGQQKPIVVSKDNVVIAGNGTLEAAKALGWEKIEIRRSNLEGSEITAFGIADNRTSELAEWDDAVLTASLQALADEKMDLKSIGFDDKDMARLLKNDKAPGEKYKTVFEIVVECADETEQESTYKLITDMGMKCRVLSM